MLKSLKGAWRVVRAFKELESEYHAPYTTILAIDRAHIDRVIGQQIQVSERRIKLLKKWIREKESMIGSDPDVNKEAKEAIGDWKKEIDSIKDRIHKLENLKSKIYSSKDDLSKFLRSVPTINRLLEKGDINIKKENERWEKKRRLFLDDSTNAH